jgi:hypothetical protein
MWRPLSDRPDAPARRLWKRRWQLPPGDPGGEDSSPATATWPQREAPRRFFEAMKTGDLTPLDEVFEHNRLDVTTR